MPASNLCINNILNYNFGSNAYAETLPATMYFGLSTTLVTAASTGATVTEPAGGSYARKSFTNNDTNWDTSTLGTLHNDVAVTFVESTAAWSTTITPILSVFIADASATGTGNIWWFDTLAVPLVVPDNTIVSFPIGTIVVTQVTTSMTTATANNILNYNFGSQAYSPALPATMYFGLSTTPVTATGLTTATEPLSASGYARIPLCNTSLASVTAMAYTLKEVTLTANNVYAIGDPITVAGVNAGFTVTNIDGNWICKTGTNATTVVFDVTDQPTGATPQTITVGTINCTNWSTSTAQTLHNNVPITFAVSTASWGIIKSLFIADSITRAAGNILWYKTLSPTVIVQDDTIQEFAASSIVVTMT